MASNDLLLLHGTIYGTVGNSAPPVYWPGLPIPTGVFDAQAGYFHVVKPQAPVSGPMTDNAPIDVVNWPGLGAPPSDAAAIWRQCIMLLSRV